MATATATTRAPAGSAGALCLALLFGMALSLSAVADDEADANILAVADASDFADADTDTDTDADTDADNDGVDEDTGVELLDNIVVVINDDVITSHRFEQEILQLEQRAPSASAVDFASDRVRAQILQKMIDDNLVLQMAGRAGIVIDELSMDSYMRQLAEGSGKSLTEFRNEVVERGLSFDEFRERVREDLIRQRMIYGYVAGRIVVLDEEIDRYMKKIPELMDDEFLFSRVLIRSVEFDSTKRRTQELETLEDYKKSRASGTNFKDLIALYSNDPSRLSQGDMGWVPARNLPSPYLDALLSMDKGEVSKPLILPSGIHILKLRDLRRRDAEISEEVLTQRILIESRGERTPEHNQIKSNFVYERLNEGEDFDRVAQQYSDDVVSSPAGGDIGWVTENDVSPPVWQAMSSLRKGEYTAPVLTPYGWEILRVKDRRQSDQTEVLRRERARNNIMQSRLEGELITWLREVRGSAYIEIIDEGIAGLEADADAKNPLLTFPDRRASDSLITDFNADGPQDSITTVPLD